MSNLKKAKIVATLGPASSSEEIIRLFVESGVNVFRLNFSHGTPDLHLKNAELIRKIEEKLETHLAILMDLQGPKIRIGMFEDGSAILKKGAKFSLDLNKDYGNSKRVTLPHPELFASLKEGAELLLDDGKIKLRIEENKENELITEVIEEGVISNKKGVNIPNVILPINALTEKDKEDLKLVERIDADWIAVSFIQTEKDIEYARNFFDNKIGVVAKIEKPSAVERIDLILKVTDAVMVARGDLGVEMPYESIPGIQRMIINKARYHRKPVIVATQMLESMIKCHIPTRAEVSDVSCAIAEGADAVMLSAESAAGEYPVESVATMAKIITQTESDNLDFFQKEFENLTAMSESIRKTVAIDEIKAIAAFTESGRCAINVSNSRTKAAIFAFTPNLKTARKLSLVWGVTAVLVDEVFTFAQMTQIVQTKIKQASCSNYDKVAIVAGLPFRSSGQTNLIHVLKIEKD